jgi:hypothetical protein
VKSAKKPRSQRTVSRPAVSLDTTPDTNAPASLFDAMSDDAYVLVWWVDPAGKHKLQFRVAPHMATEEFIQEQCGGGEYVIREKVPNEAGQFEWGRQRTITIDGPHRTLTTIPAYQPKKAGAGIQPSAPSASTAAAPSHRVGMDDVMQAAVINMLRQQQEFTDSQVRAMRDMMSVQKESGFDKFIAILAPALPDIIKLLSGRREERNSMAELKEVADMMKTLKEAAGTPTNPATEYLDLIQRVLKVKREMIDDDDDEKGDSKMSSTERIIDKLGEPILNLLTKSQERPVRARPAAPATRQLPATSTVSTAQEPERKEAGTSAVEDLFLATQKKRLLALAQRNKDAEVIALADYEVLPDTYLGPLKAWLGKEDVFQELMEKVPEFQQFHEWFALYFETLHREFFPEQYEEDDNNNEEERGDGEDTGADETGSEDNDGTPPASAGGGEAAPPRSGK